MFQIVTRRFDVINAIFDSASGRLDRISKPRWAKLLPIANLGSAFCTNHFPVHSFRLFRLDINDSIIVANPSPEAKVDFPVFFGEI